MKHARIAGTAMIASVAASCCAISATSSASPRAAAAATPQTIVTSVKITRSPGTLAPGTKVSSSSLGQRVFVDAKHGFALSNTGQAQYPAATSDGGKTWRTNGPALHLNAAQAPLVVLHIGATSRKTVFAYGGGQALDATSDGGKTWYRALFNDLVMAVVPGIQGHLVAFIDASTSSTSTNGVTWQYVSRNGGRTWRYDSTVGGS